MDILWLDSMGVVDRALVGGKAANLALLAQRYRVPSGFCVTADMGAATVVSADTGATLLPESVRTRILAAYEQLAAQEGIAEPRVAVRSSAADEDGSAASFAGQHETYLNITGGDAVVAAVARCLASAHSERAAAYRQLHGLTPGAVRIAVLVQLLVPANVSAVVFSANPITGDRQQVLINANWGLGESIVGGTVTPDSYVVRKWDGSLLSRQIAEKRRMTIAVPGGTEEVDVPRLLRLQPTLNEMQAAAMARLAISLEETMGWPVDIECALRGDDLSLLQCRPITTLRTPAREPIALSRSSVLADAAGD
jgi:phosphoenolpyruvate synthase/pyruvate phosphate dikinase